MKKVITAEGRDKKFKHLVMADVIRKNMKEYGLDVAEDRAIQDIRDGMKPSQRRVLWAMCDLKAFSSSKTHKCARIVGQAMGAYHPHGDCLDGDTIVPLINEDSKTIRELCESAAGSKDVISYDREHNCFVSARAHSWRIGQYASKQYEIELLDGTKLPPCTSNHPFYVVDKGFVKAENLKVWDELKGGSLGCSVGYKYIKLNGGCFIKSILIREVKSKPMYDFTVDKYENMIVSLQGKEDAFVIAHNSSIYAALVNMVNAENPVIEGQGNFGSLTDGAASSRYTEARISKLGMKMLECDEVADYIPNYTGDLKEPIIFPTRLPLYLLNGGSGIAVGLSCRMPAHNLKEVVSALKYVIKKGDASTIKGILKRMPAPDYQYSGRILSDEKEIKEVYKTGRGKIRYSCDYHFEHNKNSTTLIITGCCPDFYPDNFLKSMGILVEDGIILGANNATTKNGGFKIEIEMRSSSIFDKYIKKHLEKSVTYQFYAIEREKEENNPEKDVSVRIETPNILDIMQTWIDWRRVVEVKMQKLDLSRERLKLFRSKCRLDASQNIDIIMAAVKQDKIEPRDYLVKKLPYLVSLVKKSKEKQAYEGADYIGSQQVFSLKKADQSKITSDIKSSLKQIHKIKYNINHIDEVVIQQLDNLSPFFKDRNLKLKGTYEEEKIRHNKSKDIQVVGISEDAKKEIVNMSSKSLGSYYYSTTYDGVYYCTTEGKVVLTDSFEFTGKDRNTTVVGLCSNDCPRFMVRTSSSKVSYLDNDNSDLFNSVKLKDSEQVLSFDAIYKGTKVVVFSSTGCVKVLNTDKYSSSRRNTYAKSSGTGFKSISKAILCYRGCKLLTNDYRFIEPEEVTKKTKIIGQVGDTNLVILSSGKKSIEKMESIKGIKNIAKIYPISFKSRK